MTFRSSGAAKGFTERPDETELVPIDRFDRSNHCGSWYKFRLTRHPVVLVASSGNN
jgi:hypothetical protein